MGNHETEPLISFHLLRYMVRIWEQILKEREAKRKEEEARRKKEKAKKGLQKGLLQTRREVIIEILETRFQQVPGAIEEALARMEDLERLGFLFKKALVAPSLIVSTPHHRDVMNFVPRPVYKSL